MSFFETDEGKKYNIFGEGGVEKLSKNYNKEFLGKIPIDIDLRVAADNGKPLVEENPDHKISKIFKEMATKIKVSFL
jgi:ATP-binding protein involved in chromosome partitioning